MDKDGTFFLIVTFILLVSVLLLVFNDKMCDISGDGLVEIFKDPFSHKVLKVIIKGKSGWC